MDEIDRTFKRLSRENFNDLVRRLRREGLMFHTWNPYSNEPEAHLTNIEHSLIGSGWTEQEFREELERKI